MNGETEEFLDWLPRMVAAERAIHEGDAEPRIALWSHRDPVTLFGARLEASGWSEVEPTFREVASWFTDSKSYDFEVVAAGASGDLAYVVAHERNEVTHDGKPGTYTLRSTHVFRREDGEWKIVHRHADPRPASDAPLGGSAR